MVGYQEKKIMKRCLAASFILFLATTVSWAASDREETVERLQMSAEVLKALMNAPDKGVPEEVVDNSKCIVVVPHLVKGGFIVGAKHGRGVATCRTGKGWSAPAFVSIGGGSWGLQIGVEGVDLLIFVMNDKGLEHMLSSKFQITGEGSAAAGPVGRHASAGTDWKLNTELLTYSRSKGAFAGLTLEGAVIEQDNDSTKAIYGKEVPFKTVLTGGIPSPAEATQFMAAVGAANRQAAAAEAKESKK
jgi:lipid-binding SYLF domain-containing protein